MTAIVADQMRGGISSLIRTADAARVGATGRGNRRDTTAAAEKAAAASTNIASLEPVANRTPPAMVPAPPTTVPVRAMCVSASSSS